jgi:hypothetical protein
VKTLAKRAAITASAVAAALVVMTAPAFAATSEADVYTDGTAAGKAWFNAGAGQNYWDIKDTKCDGRAVILEYSINGSWYTWQMSAGCGNTSRYYLSPGYPGNWLEYHLCMGPAQTPCGPYAEDHKG